MTRYPLNERLQRRNRLRSYWRTYWLPIVLTVLFLLGTWAVTGSGAQTPTRPQNPSAIAFNPSDDHAMLTHYEAEIVTSPGGVTIATLNLGKPDPDAANDITVPLNVQPITFGSYVIYVRSVAAGVSGPRSNATVIWDRAPGAPRSARIK